jgi:S-adenosylmethionine-diacylglycerol 3-amino-3-carboxypropyl transferase
MSTEAAKHADFTRIRYAQLWEDADVLLKALDVQPSDICLSIASAGDNALALLSRSPKKVIAVDLNPAQLACLELRVAAFRRLNHPDLLELLGVLLAGREDSAAPERRVALYQRIRSELSPAALKFWEAHPELIRRGAATVGKFESYFELFRRCVMPLIHSRSVINKLLAGGTIEARREFYDRSWNTWRWRLLFKIFFSRQVMGRFGRDPAFFRYVEGSVGEQILTRVHHALTELDPADNSYLQWILLGGYRTALPYALRAENFQAIRENLPRLEWHCGALEDFLDGAGAPISKFNLSDIFEYMAEPAYHTLLKRLCSASRPGGRLAYWNMLAPRRRPESMAKELRPLSKLAGGLHLRDKAFFYSAFVVEEVLT